jgi:hypothetical protein
MTLHLTNDSPDEWAGSFVIAVRALVDDILSDGAPFEATVVFEDGAERFERTGSVSRRADGYIVIDGDLLSDLDIVGIHVP